MHLEQIDIKSWHIFSILFQTKRVFRKQNTEPVIYKNKSTVDDSLRNDKELILGLSSPNCLNTNQNRALDLLYWDINQSQFSSNH